MSRGAAEEGFLSRWSRRKREAAAAPPPPPELVPEEVAADQPPPAAAVVEPAAAEGAAAAEIAAEAPAPAAADPPAEPFDLADLPPVEGLTAESDLSVFLRPQVPAALRNAALRRVWSLDPAIRDYVGPADYAWDFNAPDGVPGFALELGADAKRLLAQAVGLDRGGGDGGDREAAGAEPPPLPAGEGQGGGGGADGDSEGAAIPPADSSPAGGEGDLALPAPAAATLETSPLRLDAPVPQEANPLPAAVAEPAAPQSLPRRRHGGARPA